MSLALFQGLFIFWLSWFWTEAFFNSGFTKVQIKTDLWTPSCLLYSVACSGWGEAAQPHSSWLLLATGTEHEVTLTKDSLLVTRISPTLITIKAICRACVDFMVQGVGTQLLAHFSFLKLKSLCMLIWFSVLNSLMHFAFCWQNCARLSKSTSQLWSSSWASTENRCLGCLWRAKRMIQV